MGQNLKHVGRVVASNKKVLVAYRTLPGDAYSCLVVPTENLDDQYHNAIINLVESPAAQASYEFAEALDRTQFPDGSRMLPSLHTKGQLVKLPTSQVEMIPAPGVSVLLSELNQLIAEQRGVAVDDLAIRPDTAPKEPAKPVTREEVVSEAKVPDATIDESASPEDQAKFYRSQADKLSKQAAEMRRKAEELVPTKKSK